MVRTFRRQLQLSKSIEESDGTNKGADVMDHSGDSDDVGGELEPEAELVALRLVDGFSHAEAAMAIGRSAKWVQRRLVTDAEFRRRVADLKAARVDQASAGLGALLEIAVDVVKRNLDAEKPADQLHAARLVMDRSRLFRADADMMAEVAELRTQVAQLRALVESTPAATDRGTR